MGWRGTGIPGVLHPAIQLAAVKARFVAQPRIGRVQPGGGLVFQSRILLVAEVLVNPRQQLVRLEQVRVGFDRLDQFDLGTLKIAALEEDAGAIDMALGRRQASGQRGANQRDGYEALGAPGDGCLQGHDWLRGAGAGLPSWASACA